jgi:hypothetical protein
MPGSANSAGLVASQAWRQSANQRRDRSGFREGKRIPAIDMIFAMRSALEVAGVAFLSDGETIQGGPGVQLKEATISHTHIQDGEAGIIENSEM